MLGFTAWQLKLYAFLPLFLPALFLTRLRMLIDGPSAMGRLNLAGKVSLVVFFVWVEVEAQALGLRPLWSLSAWAVLVDVLATSRWLLLLLTILLLAVYAHVDSSQRGSEHARSGLLSQAGLCAMVLGAVEVAHIPLTGSDGLVHIPSNAPVWLSSNGLGGFLGWLDSEPVGQDATKSYYSSHDVPPGHGAESSLPWTMAGDVSGAGSPALGRS